MRQDVKVGLNSRLRHIANSLVLLHDKITRVKILKHAFYFGGEQLTAFILELSDHRSLSIQTGTLLQKQSSAETSRIELFEYVLGLHIAEELDDIVNEEVKLGITTADHCLLRGGLLEIIVKELG